MKIINDIFWSEDSKDSEEKPIKKNVNKNKNKNIVQTKREDIKKEHKEIDNGLETIDWFKETEDNIINSNTSNYRRDIKAIDELSNILGDIGYKN